MEPSGGSVTIPGTPGGDPTTTTDGSGNPPGGTTPPPGGSVSPVTVQISAVQATIAYGSPAHLQWSSSNAIACSVKVNGEPSALSTALSQANFATATVYLNSTFTLSCSNSVGSLSASAAVSVSAPTDHYIFVTSTGHNGNFGVDGLAGADQFCQQHADASAAVALKRPSRPWKALIGTGAVALRNRITFVGSIKNLQNELLSEFADISDRLFSGVLNTPARNLLSPVDFDETGTLATNGEKAWTGSNMDGSNGGGASHCNNWTSTTGNGNIGQVNQDDDWLRDTTTPTSSCGTQNPLYCVSQ